MLHSGDILLAINGASLENANLSQAAEALKNAGDRVSLKVTKENGKPMPPYCYNTYNPSNVLHMLIMNFSYYLLPAPGCRLTPPIPLPQSPVAVFQNQWCSQWCCSETT